MEKSDIVEVVRCFEHKYSFELSTNEYEIPNLERRMYKVLKSSLELLEK